MREPKYAIRAREEAKLLSDEDLILKISLLAMGDNDDSDFTTRDATILDIYETVAIERLKLFCDELAETKEKLRSLEDHYRWLSPEERKPPIDKPILGIMGKINPTQLVVKYVYFVGGDCWGFIDMERKTILPEGSISYWREIDLPSNKNGE